MVRHPRVARRRSAPSTASRAHFSSSSSTYFARAPRLQPERIAGEIDLVVAILATRDVELARERASGSAASSATANSVRLERPCSLTQADPMPRRRAAEPFERRAGRRRARVASGTASTSISSPGLRLAEREGIVAAERDRARRPSGRTRCSAASADRARANRRRCDPDIRAAASALATAHRSGRASKPCSMRPSVPGNAPPPWANAIRSAGSRSSTPPKMSEQIASETSAGIPTSQGSQYFCIRSWPPSCPTDGRRPPRPARPRASKTGNSAGSVEVPAVDVGADLDAGEPELPHAALELAHREIGRLHRQRPEAGEPRADARGTTAAMWSFRQRASRAPARAAPVIREHHRHRREHLHVDAEAASHSREPRPGVPAIALDLAEEAPVVAHGRARPSSTRSIWTKPPADPSRGSSGGRMWVWMSIFIMLAAALPAVGVRRIVPEYRVEDRRQLLDDVGQMEVFARTARRRTRRRTRGSPSFSSGSRRAR